VRCDELTEHHRSICDNHLCHAGWGRGHRCFEMPERLLDTVDPTALDEAEPIDPDQKSSWFCPRHIHKECKSNYSKDRCSWEKLRGRQFCSMHACEGLLVSKRETVPCPDEGRVDLWCLCDNCNMSAGCAAQCPGTRCGRKLAAPGGLYCKKHICHFVNGGPCLAPSMAQSNYCEEHAGCPFITNGRRCDEPLRCLAQTCERHTCCVVYDDTTASWRCNNPAEKENGTCVAHRTCDWRFCPNLRDGGSHYCTGHRCEGADNLQATERCPNSIALWYNGATNWYQGSRLCSAHKCQRDDCYHQRLEFWGVCEQHRPRPPRQSVLSYVPQ
jgi:hypothetical protein